LAKTEICLIDSANKIRNSIPVASMAKAPQESQIHKINAELKA
jgi:hypothetical protein